MRPLSPECLKANIKYGFDSKGYHYVGYFFELRFYNKHVPITCVFTSLRSGKGEVVYADAPIFIENMVFAPNQKCGVSKG